MPTHQVVLTESQEALIEALVESGRYANANEVLREGLEAIERGEFEEFPDVKALLAHLDDYGDKIISGAEEA